MLVKEKDGQHTSAIEISVLGWDLMVFMFFFGFGEISVLVT